MAFTVASSVAGVSNTGRSSQGHVRYAVNQGAYWVFYLSSTQSLSALYSTDSGTSWTAPTNSPFTLANAHGSEGRNFGFDCLNLSSTDVLHMVSNYSGVGGAYHARFILGTTWTNSNAETLNSGGKQYSPSGYVTATVSGDIPVDGGPNWNYGNAGIEIGSHADSGSSWTAGFGSANQAVAGSNNTSSTAIFDTGSGTAFVIADNNSNAADSSNNLLANAWSGSAFGTQGNVFSGNWTVAASGECWGACLRTTSDVHVVALTDNASTLSHRRWNGSTWSAGDSVPPLALAISGGVVFSGVSLVTDGTSVWMAAVDTSNNIKYSKWTSGSGWSAWTTLEATRTNTPGYITGTYNGSNKIMWVWTENTGSSINIVGSTLTITGGATPWLFLPDQSMSGNLWDGGL